VNSVDTGVAVGLLYLNKTKTNYQLNTNYELTTIDHNKRTKTNVRRPGLPSFNKTGVDVEYYDTVRQTFKL